MIEFKEIQTFLVEKGVSLHEIGVNDFSLRREDALLLCALLEKASLPILGGDVYHLNQGTIEITYDNWFFSQHEGEKYENYKKRTVVESKVFIEKYMPTKDNILFNIVFG